MSNGYPIPGTRSPALAWRAAAAAARGRVGAKRLAFVALGLVVLFACVLSTVWALRVPVFLAPDEAAHMDYAFELYDVGAPFVVTGARPETLVTRQARYLATVTEYRRLRYSSFARVAADYAGAERRAAIDAGAPRPSRRVPRDGAPMPYVMFAYPIGYYVLLSSVMIGVGRLTGDSITAVFYAARLVNVALLAGTLVFSYGAFRAYRLPRAVALLATCALGTFPLVSWVAGYAQPDNLSFLLVSAAICAVARWRKTRFDLPKTSTVSLLVCALFFTKQHYALALFAAILAALLTRIDTTQKGAVRFACWFIAIVPPACAAYASFRITPIARLSQAQHYVANSLAVGSPVSTIERFASFARFFAHGFIDIFFDGTGFGGYWFRFGVRGGSIYGSTTMTSLSLVLEVLTVAVMLTLAVATVRLVRRLATVAVRRSARTAFSIAAGSAPALTYVFATVAVLAIYALFGGALALQGRYWLPVELCLFILLLVAVPSAMPARARRPAAMVFAGLLAAYSLTSSTFALAALQRQYYDVPDPRLVEASLADIESVSVAGRTTTDLDAGPVTIGRGNVRLTGYDVDGRSGLPGRAVSITLDGRTRIAARTGIARREMAGTFHDDALQNAGFVVDIPARLLTPGRHVIRAAIEDPRLGGSLRMHRVLELDVVPSGDAHHA